MCRLSPHWPPTSKDPEIQGAWVTFVSRSHPPKTPNKSDFFQFLCPSIQFQSLPLSLLSINSLKLRGKLGVGLGRSSLSRLCPIPIDVYITHVPVLRLPASILYWGPQRQRPSRLQFEIRNGFGEPKVHSLHSRLERECSELPLFSCRFIASSDTSQKCHDTYRNFIARNVLFTLLCCRFPKRFLSALCFLRI